VESEDYAQYTFPALKALEGHIKFLMKKANICFDSRQVGASFKPNNDEVFVLNETNIVDDINLKQNIEKCYNYYYKNRHTLFHFGDLIGNIDNTRMIETKREADEIIDSIIKIINETSV
jgi:ribonuclease HI